MTRLPRSYRFAPILGALGALTQATRYSLELMSDLNSRVRFISSMRAIWVLVWFCTLAGTAAVATEIPQPAEPAMASGANAASTPTANFYVAPNGKDSWSGKLAAPNAASTDGPFASVAKAQIAVQSLISTHPSRRLWSCCDRDRIISR